jgi:hypothetical protein
VEEALVVAANDLSIGPGVDAPGQEEALTATFDVGRKGKAGVRHAGLHRGATGKFGGLALLRRLFKRRVRTREKSSSR